MVESHDWDWKVADRHLQRALALAPGNADVLRGVASLAGILGRADESLDERNDGPPASDVNDDVFEAHRIEATIAGPPKAGGTAKTALLGTDKNPSGGRVVTYNKWPLYTYSGDSAAGEA